MPRGVPVESDILTGPRSAAPELRISPHFEEILSRIPKLYQQLDTTRKVLTNGKLANARNWIGGVEMQMANPENYSQLVVLVGEADAAAVRDGVDRITLRGRITTITDRLVRTK
jgi:hypothetical protein